MRTPFRVKSLLQLQVLPSGPSERPHEGRDAWLGGPGQTGGHEPIMPLGLDVSRLRVGGHFPVPTPPLSCDGSFVCTFCTLCPQALRMPEAREGRKTAGSDGARPGAQAFRHTLLSIQRHETLVRPVPEARTARTGHPLGSLPTRGLPSPRTWCSRDVSQISVLTCEFN